ncbi:MAG: hypothetical protein NTY51_00215 [Deltaproteobacteria bacterium]|nr:hypothetical protein [Deltaproteobacteria bacterium]
MGLFDTHLDVLQNIEFAIVNVYEDRPALTDYTVMKALDALIGLYRAESLGHTPKEISLEEDEAEVLDRVRTICEWRMGREKQTIDLTLDLDQLTSLDDTLSCLKKIRRSVEKWNGRGGSQGYLRFVSQYVG